MKSHSSEIRRARPLLGTLVEIGAIGVDATTAINAAFREIETIHRLMSFHEMNSDVSRINRAAPRELVRVDRRTYEVLTCAQWLSRLSTGSFDITVGGRLVEAGFLPRPHCATELDTEACFDDLLLLPDHCLTWRRCAWIDLGGIAKGYAVDRAVEVLKQYGVRSGIVNAGGDLSVFGKSQPIYVRDPVKSSLVFPLGPITNAAVASSSGFFTARGHDGPLVEPRRGRCVKWRKGITVIAARCMIADALTKVVRLAPRRALKILTRFNAQALLIDRRGVRSSAQPRSRNQLTCADARFGVLQ